MNKTVEVPPATTANASALAAATDGGGNVICGGNVGGGNVIGGGNDIGGGNVGGGNAGGGTGGGTGGGGGGNAGGGTAGGIGKMREAVRKIVAAAAVPSVAMAPPMRQRSISALSGFVKVLKHPKPGGGIGQTAGP